MPYVLRAAFWVGVIGTAAAAPLLCALRLEPSLLGDTAFQWSSPVMLFLLAGLSFMATYMALPTSRWRSRIAGLLAGAITFFGFALITSVMLGIRRGAFASFPGVVHSFALAFVLTGWIPLGGGWFAGWVVSKLPDTPADEAQ